MCREGRLKLICFSLGKFFFSRCHVSIQPTVLNKCMRAELNNSTKQMSPNLKVKYYMMVKKKSIVL